MKKTKTLLIILTVLFVFAGETYADLKQQISKEYTYVSMTTPDAWMYLRRMKYNPILGGVAFCDGGLDIVLSEQDNSKYLLFTFTSNTTGRSVVYLISDVRKFLTTLKKAASEGSNKQSVLCHEGVNMNDNSRSNYVLKKDEKGNFTIEFDRSNIGIIVVLSKEARKSLIDLVDTL